MSSRLIRDCRGAVYIEFLLVSLPLIAITFGLAQSALIYLGSSAVERAAGVAARAAIVVLDDDPKNYGGVPRNSATGARLAAIEEAASFPLMPFEESSEGTIAASLTTTAYERLAGIGSIFGSLIASLMSSSFSLSSLMPSLPAMPGLGSIPGIGGMPGLGGIPGMSIPGISVPGINLPGVNTGVPGLGTLGGGTLGGFSTPSINLPSLPSLPSFPSAGDFVAPNFGGGGGVEVEVLGGGGRGSPVTVIVTHQFRCRVPIGRLLMCGGSSIELSADSTLPNMASKFRYGRWN